MTISVFQLEARTELRSMADRTPAVTDVGPALFSQTKVLCDLR